MDEGSVHVTRCVDAAGRIRRRKASVEHIEGGFLVEYAKAHDQKGEWDDGVRQHRRVITTVEDLCIFVRAYFGDAEPPGGES